MIYNLSYMSAIGENWPNVICKCVGDPNFYENIIWEGGDPLPDKSTLDAWIEQDIKNKKWKEIQEFRDSRIQTGGYQVNGNWFHSDNISRIQQIGLLLMGTNMPTGIMWKTMSGSFVEMTPTLAQLIFAAAGNSDIAMHAAAETHKQQMLASSDPRNYDYKNLAPTWPPIYGE